jgi:hypothetical protein
MASRVAGWFLCAGLTLSMPYAFGVVTLGGCGGSQAGFAPPADGQLPERVVDKLTACTRRGPAALQPEKHTVSFDVFMNDDGQVEQVALRDSTFHLDEIEACMEDALHALSERAADASLRRRPAGPSGPVSPGARGLLAQPWAIPAGAAQAIVVAGLLVITVFVYYQVVHNTKPHRPPPAKAETNEPPAPVLSAATAEPMVSAAPAASAVPSTTAPTMPTTLPLADQELWRKCNQQHDTYKATQDEAADYAKRMAPIEHLLHNNKASAAQRAELCSMLEKRVKLKQREYKERSRYVELDCDKFDWFDKGTTKAQRLARHQLELNNVDADLKNLYGLKNRFCQ